MRYRLPLPWLNLSSDCDKAVSNISLSDVAEMFHRSKTMVFNDFQFLGVDTSVIKDGGSVSIGGAWTLYLYYCWVHIQHSKSVAGFDRGFRRSRYWADVSPSDAQDPSASTSLEALRISFMIEAGGSEEDFDRRWSVAIAKANEKFYKGQEYGKQFDKVSREQQYQAC